MQSISLRSVRLGTAMLLLLVPWISEGAVPSNLGELSDAEVARLPAYCVAKIGALRNDPAQVAHWDQVMGHDKFVHIHHYCNGMGFLNRARLAFGADRGNRARYLQRASGDFMYVINAWPKDFSLQADAHLGMGQVEQLSGGDVKAIGFYMKAISIRPDFAQAYAALADLWMDRGEKAKAREVLEQGLKNTSNADMLVSRMARLEAGGSASQPAKAGAPGRTTPGQGSAKKP